MCNERQRGFVLSGKACHMFERPEKAISMETCKKDANQSVFTYVYMPSQFA